MSLNKLKNGVNLFNKIINELRNNEFPNDWKFISSPEQVINNKTIIFSKQLSNDDLLFELINKYRALGFNTERQYNGCYEKKDDDLFPAEINLEFELCQAITFDSGANPLIYLKINEGQVNIYCCSISASRHAYIMALESRAIDSEHLLKPNDYASIKVEIPFEIEDIERYLL